jgi:hypothetical protein
VRGSFKTFPKWEGLALGRAGIGWKGSILLASHNRAQGHFASCQQARPRQDVANNEIANTVANSDRANSCRRGAAKAEAGSGGKKAVDARPSDP